MHRIKGYSSYVLRKEFPQIKKMASMWTRSYFVSTTGNVSSATIQRYIEVQGKDLDAPFKGLQFIPRPLGVG
jgi:putative transposase